MQANRLGKPEAAQEPARNRPALLDAARRACGPLAAAALLAGPAAMTASPAAASPDAHYSPATVSLVGHEAAPAQGKISYYASQFAGRLTASGEVFDPDAMTMAHPTLPFGTLVRVTTLHGERSVVLKVNDRGPFHGARIADVSPAAARLLGMIRKGLVKVRLEVIDPVLSPAAGSRQAPSRPHR
ncbi:MAG TPA: septal ring lytic transglycosylase RlpA family protein [Quisquiliibacterium sp.]|nr:septal ring lytic transglycosylase RlpA family protein [Quisquiliibacterium sp.]